MLRRLLCLIPACLLISQLLLTRAPRQQPPHNDTDDGPQPRAAAYAEIVRADQPVAWWRFDDSTGTAELAGSPWPAQQSTAGVKFVQPGPRQTKFPLFDAANHAALFEK